MDFELAGIYPEISSQTSATSDAQFPATSRIPREREAERERETTLYSCSFAEELLWADTLFCDLPQVDNRF